MAFQQTHLPCPKCGSSDARGANADGSSKCFSCGTFVGTRQRDKRSIMDGSFVMNGKVQALARRGLTKETCQKWGYHVAEVDGDTIQIANYRAQNGNLVGQKLRYPDKSFKVRGELVGLYGQHIWKDGGRRVVVTEGEVDALSVSQAFDNRWPVVSVPHRTTSGPQYGVQALAWMQRKPAADYLFDIAEPGSIADAAYDAVTTSGIANKTDMRNKDATHV